MIRRFAFIDDNLSAHIRTLRWTVAALTILLAITAIGLYGSNRTHRLSLPPRLIYGADIETGVIHPWEVYSFAGYIWQLMNRCETDCSMELPERQQRMTRFITPAFAADLERDRSARIAELKGRTRYMLPIRNWNSALVTQPDSDRWHVTLDVDLVETLRSVEIKRTPVRYTLMVTLLRVDPEFNPWGLMLDGFAIPPQRLEDRN